MQRKHCFLFSVPFAAAILLLITLLWTVCYVVLAFTRLLPLEKLIAVGDVYQLVQGLGATVILLSRMKYTSRKYLLLGTGLAVFSWTVGQLFWFSYTLLANTPLPYPSVGDLGFTGAYFFLIGVIGLLSKDCPKSPFAPLAFIILLVPALLATSQSTLAVKLYNVVLGCAAAYTLYKAIPLGKHKKYRWFLYGILLLVFTDVVFMISVVYFRDSFTMTSAPLYPLALSVVTYGILKGEAG